jgi:hypothetical protein
MKRILFSTVLAFALTGCAASRGFVTGMFSGPGVVDEAVNYKHKVVDTASAEFNGKMWTHRAILISTGLVLWPFAAAYGGASGVYGAYKYDKELKDAEEWRVLYR